MMLVMLPLISLPARDITMEATKSVHELYLREHIKSDAGGFLMG